MLIFKSGIPENFKCHVANLKVKVKYSFFEKKKTKYIKKSYEQLCILMFVYYLWLSQ